MNTYFYTWLTEFVFWLYKHLVDYWMPVLMLMHKYNKGEFF